ncbi:MAG: hypothetical protein ABSD31_12260 [Candidatus Binataceae bacterium]
MGKKSARDARGGERKQLQRGRALRVPDAASITKSASAKRWSQDCATEELSAKINNSPHTGRGEGSAGAQKFFNQDFDFQACSFFWNT